jgi:hypothetical protein
MQLSLRRNEALRVQVSAGLARLNSQLMQQHRVLSVLINTN